MIAIRKDIALARQVGSGGVDKIEARKVELFSDFLSAELLLDCDWEVRTALLRIIVCDNHTELVIDQSYT